MYVCRMSVCMHACMHGWMDGWMYVCPCACTIDETHAVERHYCLLPNPYLEIRVFVDGVHTSRIMYQLNSIILHQGVSPDSGGLVYFIS